MFKHHRFGRYKYQESGLKIRRPIERYIMRGATIGFTTFLATLLSASIFAPVEATDATEVLSALSSTDSAVSISTSASSIDLSLATSSVGAVRTVSDTVTVTAGSTGYQLYIGTSGASNALVRDGTSGTSSDELIPASTTTDISAPATLTNNTWGFAVPARNTASDTSGSADVVSTAGFGEASTYPTGDNSVATSTFVAVPTHGDDVLIAKRSGATSANGVPTNFYYGVKATTAKPSGLYKNTIVYTAIGDSTVENLASVTPERTNKISGGEELIISTPSTTALSSIAANGLNVTVGGMTCTNPIATKNDNGTGSLTNITCTAPALATGWHEVVANITTTAGNTETYIVNPGIEYYTEDGIMAMQNFTEQMCMEMNVLDTITLIDNRDDNTYKITRQRDGNCWMVQNLRLGTTPDGQGIQNVTLTAQNSDITGADKTLVVLGSGETLADRIQTSANPTGDWSTVVNTYHVYSFAGTDDAVKYGNLYNFYTATAGYTNDYSDSPTSICPSAGNNQKWQLPSGSSASSSYATLIQAQIPGIPIPSIGTSNYVTQFASAPLSLVPSSRYANTPVGLGDFGGYWTRTSRNANEALAVIFALSNQGYGINSNDYRRYGYAVRCVLTTPSMQDFTSTICTNLETAKTLTLVDNRDWNDYKVTKEADNNCWMTQNLRLGTINNGSGVQNVTLTTANTDLTSGTTNTSLVVLGSGEQLSDRIQTSANPTGSWADPVDAYHIYSFAGTANATTYGNLYNWYTATAASGTAALTSGDAPMSICPANWKLPPNTGTGSYTSLIQTQIPNIPLSSLANAEGRVYIAQFVQAPLSFTISGYYDYSEGGIREQNWYGRYWSRTAYVYNDESTVFGLNFHTSGGFHLQRILSRYWGSSVRCVFIPS